MKTIKIDEQKNFLNVVFNRPDKHNSFNPEFIYELTQIFKTAGKNKKIRAIILSGEGPSFCAGADLTWMRSMAQFSLQQNKKDAGHLYDMFKSGYDCTLPIIGKIHGNVFGGGVGIVSLCDIAIAEPGVQFCFSEVKLGLVPAVISSFVLDKMEKNLAHMYMLTGQVFTAEEALRSGLVQKVVAKDQLDSEVSKTLKHFLKAGPEAVSETKSLLRKIKGLTSAKVKLHSVDVIARRRVSAEGQEGFKGFFSNQSPTWVDKE